MEQQEKKWTEVTNERWVVWPASIQQNFDANGSPCDEVLADYVIPELIREVTLAEPLKFIRIDFTLGENDG